MTTKERILHSILFEVFALLILMGLASIFTQHNPAVVGGLSVAMSLIAMTWNYIYNLLFDRAFGTDRLSRKLGLRIIHGIGFEGGLLFVSVPVLMWVLKMDFWSVLILDLGLVAFFLLYAIIYNWLYDHIRARFFTKQPAQTAQA
ncbi:membrane protein [Photobacterium aquae]|uniref:Membrane protein n=1 Tax=Photobacterium aquae TaxID=1195763 RepID=A0A0J1H6C2_9GAMM|nr:PACE efflux transporter [Photobacterium aquae]KLV07259.1 membrane protein [Photobacterium aquae]